MKTSAAQIQAIKLLKQKEREFLNASAPYVKELCKIEMMQTRTAIIPETSLLIEVEINWTPASEAYANGLKLIIEQIRQGILESPEVKWAKTLLGTTPTPREDVKR